MKKTTDELLTILTAVHSESELSDFTEELNRSEKALSFSNYIKDKMQERSITKCELRERSQIARSYYYDILRGDRNTPGRDKVLALCLALELSYEETQRALKLAGAGALYPRRHRDAIIIFCLEKRASVIETNLLLDDFVQELLY